MIDPEYQFISDDDETLLPIHLIREIVSNATTEQVEHAHIQCYAGDNPIMQLREELIADIDNYIRIITKWELVMRQTEEDEY